MASDSMTQINPNPLSSTFCIYKANYLYLLHPVWSIEYSGAIRIMISLEGVQNMARPGARAGKKAG